MLSKSHISIKSIFMSIITGMMIFLFFSCTHEKIPLPAIPDTEPQTGGDTYVQLNQVFDAASGYDLNHPSDVYYGADNFLYVADTDNDRIIMMDLGGGIQGYSQPVPHPEAITQNDSLQLLIVNKSNRVYRIDLFQYQHRIAEAPVQVVYEQSSQPDRQFTGISVHEGFEYYVTVVDYSVSPALSQIYDFYGNHTRKGPLPLYTNGTGLFSALLPTGIVSLRERYLDIASREDTKAFIFCQTGSLPSLNLFNYYKVQYITTTTFEGQEILTPKTDLTGSPESDYIYYYEKFFNPEDITIDFAGNMFVVDAGSDEAGGHAPAFYRFGPTGLQLQAVIGRGSADYQFSQPKGIAVTPNTERQVVFIADTGNNRIVQYQLAKDL